MIKMQMDYCFLMVNSIAEKTLRQFADIEEESSNSDEGDMEIQH